MDVRYLRHFLAVAEELHFGRAAHRLNMEQAPLSQSIRRLESWLGVPLFERSSRGTKLTKGGAALVPEARAAIEQFERAIALTRKVSGNAHDPISVGFVTAGIYRLLPEAIRSYRQKFADARVRLVEASTNDLLEAIEQDKLDLALVHPPQRRLAKIVVEDLQRDRPVAALPRLHPLARRGVVSLRELAPEPLIFFPRPTSPDLYKRILAAFTGQGLKPRIEQEARYTPTILSFVSAGLGYALVPDSARALLFPEVVFRAVVDLPDELFWRLALAWKPATAPALASAFAAILRSIAGAAATEGRLPRAKPVPSERRPRRPAGQ